jgi:serine/threonine protein kinase
MIDSRYEVRRHLGTGAGGEVYEVLDHNENDIVALKLLTTLPSTGPWLEAQILRRLSDNHILPIRNAALASGQPYLVTELATHGTLDQLLVAAGTCGLDVDDVVPWIRQACHGVARAHQLRLLHNDIKPANLFLNANREVLVGDFGLAALIPLGVTSAFPPGASAPTAAPEVASGWGTPTASASTLSDVYSLGATAYWLLAGRPPPDMTGATDVAAMMAIAASDTPPRLRDLAPHVPQSVATTIEKAIARLPSDRFASTTSFASELGRRPPVKRKWRRTDEHNAHISCWRGEPSSSGTTYLLCLESGPRPSQCSITTVHANTGRRITVGCRTAPMRSRSQAVRSVMQALH